MDAVHCPIHGFVETKDGNCPNCKTTVVGSINFDKEPPPILLGWLCPMCRKVWSPAIEYCLDCVPKEKDKNSKVLLEDKSNES